jgi:hypothetical protein
VSAANPMEDGEDRSFMPPGPSWAGASTCSSVVSVGMGVGAGGDTTNVSER